MLNFPKDDDFFENNKSLKDLIKTLESYIEIQFEMEGVLNTVCALKECTFESQEFSPIKTSLEQDTKGLTDSLKPLVERNKNSIDMRFDLWRIKDKLGVFNTLMLISPKLVLNLEMFFSGAIITYSKAFKSSQRRSGLNYQKNLGDNNELLDFHKKIIELRNKHFAHSEFEYNKHILKYILTEEKNINLEISSHTSSEFWSSFDYGLFFKLINEIKKYLSNEINSKIATIKSKLSTSQLKRLRAENPTIS